MRKPKFCFVRNDIYACGTYRTIIPCYGLRLNGYVADVYYQDNSAIFNNYDIYIIQRHYLYETFSLIYELKYKHKKKVFMDIDDNIWCHPILGEKYLNANVIYQAFNVADGVIVCSPYLKDYLQKEQKYSKPVYVIPNFYPEDFIFEIPSKADRLTFIFAGTSTHAQDVKPVIEAIKRMKEKIKFVIISQPSFLTKTELEQLKNENKIDLVFIPFAIPTTEYFKQLKTISYDYRPFLGFAPLEDNLFNRSKAYQKALEYIVCGALPIMSNLAPFQYFNNQLKNKLQLADYTAQSFYDIITNYINNFKEANELRHNLHKELTQKFTSKNCLKYYKMLM